MIQSFKNCLVVDNHLRMKPKNIGENFITSIRPGEVQEDFDNKFYVVQAWNLHDEGRLMDLVDPTLQLQTDEEREEVLRVIKIALQCLQMIGDRRPTMAQVITMLQGEVDVVVATNNDWHSLQPILSAGSSMTSGLGVIKEDFSSDHTLRVNPISTSVSHSGVSTSTIELSEILETR